MGPWHWEVSVHFTGIRIWGSAEQRPLRNRSSLGLGQGSGGVASSLGANEAAAGTVLAGRPGIQSLKA